MAVTCHFLGREWCCESPKEGKSVQIYPEVLMGAGYERLRLWGAAYQAEQWFRNVQIPSLTIKPCAKQIPGLLQPWKVQFRTTNFRSVGSLDGLVQAIELRNRWKHSCWKSTSFPAKQNKIRQGDPRVSLGAVSARFPSSEACKQGGALLLTTSNTSLS